MPKSTDNTTNTTMEGKTTPDVKAGSNQEHSSPTKSFVIPKRHIRRGESLDQPSSVSPSPEKNGLLDDQQLSESERPYGITRFKSASLKRPPARKVSDNSMTSVRSTPPKYSSSPGDLRLTPKQNRLVIDIPEHRRQPSPLQRHRHSQSQPILPGSSLGTGSSDLSRSGGQLTDTSLEHLRDALTDQEEDEQSVEESAASAILHLLYMLSRNAECHNELLSHLALPSNADRLVAMAHAPNTSIDDLSKIALLVQNMFEVCLLLTSYVAMLFNDLLDLFS